MLKMSYNHKQFKYNLESCMWLHVSQSPSAKSGGFHTYFFLTSVS